MSLGFRNEGLWVYGLRLRGFLHMSYSLNSVKRVV